MVLHSYGMLLPCGIDKFQGTEYVCCPASRTESTQPSLPSQEDDEDEEVEDEEIDEMDLDEEEAVEDRWAIAKVEGRVCIWLCSWNIASKICAALGRADVTGHLDELKFCDIDPWQLLCLSW